MFDELVAWVDTHEKPYEPKPKMTNLVMLVGLQGAGKTTTRTKAPTVPSLKRPRRTIVGVIVPAERVQIVYSFVPTLSERGHFDQLKHNARILFRDGIDWGRSCSRR